MGILIYFVSMNLNQFEYCKNTKMATERPRGGEAERKRESYNFNLRKYISVNFVLFVDC